MSDEEDKNVPQTGTGRSRLTHKRLEKQRSLKTYANLLIYRVELQRLVSRKREELNNLMLDEKAKILDEKNACEQNEYYCEVCKYKMNVAHRQVHEFMHMHASG